MCGRRSNHGIKGTVIGLFLLSLVASPCFSASAWGSLFKGNSEEGIPIVSGNQVVTVLQEESSLETPTPSQPTFDEKTLKDLQKQLDELQKTQENLMKKETELKNSTEEFLTLSQSSLDLGEITDAQYQEMLNTANGLAGANKEQADRIAELEAETGTRPYIKTGVSVGFNDLTPTYGIDAALGVRLGNHIMLEAGAGYTIGDFGGDPLYSFSMDNMEFNASVGWMF